MTRSSDWLEWIRRSSSSSSSSSWPVHLCVTSPHLCHATQRPADDQSRYSRTDSFVPVLTSDRAARPSRDSDWPCRLARWHAVEPSFSLARLTTWRLVEITMMLGEQNKCTLVVVLNLLSVVYAKCCFISLWIMTLSEDTSILTDD